MTEPVFEPLPGVPDHPALEQEILELWEREDTFNRVREQNRGGPTCGNPTTAGGSGFRGADAM